LISGVRNAAFACLCDRRPKGVDWRMALNHDVRALSQSRIFPGAALFALSTGLILGAWGFQIIGGLAPCPLCLEQRVPWYLLIALSAVLSFGLSAKWPRNAMMALFAVALGLVLWAAYLGLYHAGVEYKWWPGPSTCTTGGAPVDGSIDLNQLGGTKIPMCDIVPWSLAGISLAGFNFLFSLVGVAIVAPGLLKTIREKA
jgi:disulfide bond formation protein DsbB